MNKSIIKWVFDISKTKVFHFLMVIALVVLGTLYIYNTWTTTMNETSKQAMNTARTAEASFMKDALNKLAVSQNDIGNPIYGSIKSNLEKLVKVNKGVRFAYIYAQKSGKIYFIADSEPVDSKDYSPPGQEYTEASDEYKKPFQDGKPIITQPATDRWGTWVSMLVPMKDNETGKTVAVFGMDYPADTWKTEAVSQTVQACTTVFGLFLLIFAFHIIINKNEKMKVSQTLIQESESRLIAAQSMAHVGNWELNLDTKNIWASEEAFNIYGIESISQYLPLDRVQESVLPEYRESLNNALIGLISKKEKYDEEFKIKNVKTGEARFVHSKAISLVDETGNVTKVIGTLQDITDRKHAEDALRSNRRQLTDIIEFLPDATLAINKEGQVIIWNKAIAKMTCIPAAEMMGKCDYACTIPFYGEARPHLMDLVFLNDEEITTRYPNLTREGDTLMAEVFCPALYNNKGAWVFAKASPLHDQLGNIIGVIESIRDITEQKLAEAVLQSKTAFLEAQTNASLDGILVVNQNQTRILTNHRIFELFNVPQHIIDDDDDALLLKHVVSLTKDPEQFLKKVIYLYDHLNETSRDEIEFKSGMVLDRHSAPVMDKEGKYYGRIWTFHDITDHKRLETALEKEKSLFETTLVSVGDGVISTDNKGNIVFLNRVAELLTGWTLETARGKSIEEVFIIVNEFTREKSENIVEKALESGKILELANHTILISKDGRERPIEDSAAPIVQENGEIVGVVLVFRDFSEKKQKQERIEFLSYHDQLTGLYNRRFYEEELKRLDSEINLPISIVMGDVNGLKLINDSFGHVTGDELLKKVAEVITKGCRADDIIARLGGDEFVIILLRTHDFETEQIIKRINDLASKEKVGTIDISISFGYETKTNYEERIEDILKKAEDHMYKKKLFESPSIRGKTINAIMNALYEKNKREEQHSHRVSILCESMGKALSLPEGEIEELKTVGLLHDIGKIAIEESILNKPGKLTAGEWEEIKRHSEIGYRILSTVNDMSEMAEYVLFHHEKWDGSGYPKCLKGKEIPLQSRIIAVADAYDAMTSDRSYRNALSEAIVIEELQKNAGVQFEPELVRVFIEKVLGKICG